MTGYPGTPPLDAIKGDVVSSVSGDPVAKLTTSSDLVNQMWSIGIWGQRGNFLSIPTDCPQRDERLGWMGDAGVFWRTGSYNFCCQMTPTHPGVTCSRRGGSRIPRATFGRQARQRR
jgi:alpha-L-rhamnosidase